MKFRKVISASLALMLAASLPLSALAETYDLAKGSITVEAKADGNQYVSQDGGVQNEKQTTETVIEQDKSTSSTTTNTITIKAEEKTNDDGSKEKMTAEVTISGVDIDVSKTGDSVNYVIGEAAISTDGDGNVTIELDGGNTLKGGAYRAGLEKNNSGNLTIEDKDDNGAVTAIGEWRGAGIGGGSFGSASNITITGGDVKAIGGDYSAGIGGGASGGGSDIVIEGGDVSATGGFCGAGIGGGLYGSGTNITIKDGNVKAEGGDFGAGIGGGSDGSGSNITIEGGSVKAVGGSWGAGIGGGEESTGSDITIKGGIVEASGVWEAAGIGGGDCAKGSNITVSGDAQVRVSGGDDSPDIGGGRGEKEIVPNTDALGKKGSISYYSPDADKYTENPEKLLHKVGDKVEIHEGISIKSFTAATCTTAGSITYLCSCKAEITQTLAPLGHDLVFYDAKAPTCTEKGWNAYKACTQCDYSTYVEKPIDPDNHALKHHDAKAATCTEKGWDAYDTCTRCNYSTYVEVPIDPDNHALKHHDAKEATCTEKGWEEYDTCTRCNYSTYVERPINPSNHDLEHHDGKEPTCTEDGWEEYDTCKRKGCTYTTYQKINALNHSFTKYVYQNDATCLEDGKEIAHCDHTGCTETDVRTAVGTALGHRFTDYVYNGDADYTSDGTETAQCDHGCGETDTRPAEGTRLAIYWVTDEAGKTIAASESRIGSVLTITVNQENASLHGYTAGLRALQAEGIGTIVFVTTSATSTFEIAPLLSGSAYQLTHSGTAVGFTLDGSNILNLLK